MCGRASASCEFAVYDIPAPPTNDELLKRRGAPPKTHEFGAPQGSLTTPENATNSTLSGTDSTSRALGRVNNKK